MLNIACTRRVNYVITVSASRSIYTWLKRSTCGNASKKASVIFINNFVAVCIGIERGEKKEVSKRNVKTPLRDQRITCVVAYVRFLNFRRSRSIINEPLLIEF